MTTSVSLDSYDAFRRLGDPIADEVIEELQPLSPAEREALVASALSGADGTYPPAMQRWMEQIHTVPSWVEPKRLAHGSRAFLRTAGVGMFALGCCSTPSFYALSDGNKALSYSGRLKSRASRRGRETARFVIETCLPSSLLPGHDGFCITGRVRLMHASVRRSILNSPERWDHGRGVPISQFYMASMNALLSARWIDALGTLGMKLNETEIDGIMQLWRYSAYLIGVDSRLQFEGKQSADEFLREVFRREPPPDDEARELVSALLEAIPEVFELKDFWRRQMHRFSEGLAVALLREPLAAQLKLPRTPWRYGAGVLRVSMPMWRKLEEISPQFHRFSRNLGTKLWLGLAEFPEQGGLEMFTHAEEELERK